MSLNKVMLIGHVGKDPEVRYFRNSDPAETDAMVARFTLATNEKGRNGEVTEWHNITAWRACARFVENHVRKGSQIFVEGRLHTGSWTDQNGVVHSAAEVFAENIQLLGRKEDAEPADRQQPQARPEDFFSGDGLPF